MTASLLYSIIQYVPAPERLEAFNVGVVVLETKRRRVHARVLRDITRLRTLTKTTISKNFFDDALSDFVIRVQYEYSRAETLSDLMTSIARRANAFRLTPPQPLVVADNIEPALIDLFEGLVEGPKESRTKERVKTRLRRRLEEVGVMHLLEKKPAPVPIERYGVVLRPEYGYQNGKYNLVDASRFLEGEQGLAEAGKRALEGRTLSETLGYRLVIIGEFVNDSPIFYDAIREDLERSNVRVFDLNNLWEFAASVKYHA